jgi:ABC-2 type transport system permease protein
MNRVVFSVTLKQVAGRRRTLFMAALAVIPIGLSVLVRYAGDDVAADEWLAEFLFPVLIIGALLPLTALVFGTAVLGSEFEDGTAVYLLTKPIPRRAIILPKLLVAWIAAGTTMLVTGVIAGGASIAGEGGGQMVFGFTVATVVGALAYSALFLALSIVTSRALIIGLVYVFLWEAVITGLFTGTRIFSIREYTLGIADLLSGTPDRLFSAQLGETASIVGILLVVVGATWLAIRQLERWEIGEQT